MQITIYGPEGSGKTTISRLLAKELGYACLSSGNMMRECASKYGMDIYDFGKYIVSHPEIDRELDEMIVHYGQTAVNFVFESRLAWYWIPQSIKILLCGDPEVLSDRIAKREGLSKKEAEQKTLDRNQTNISRYRELYPEIEYPPAQGVFDFVVDTTLLSPEEIISTISQYLITRA